MPTPNPPTVITQYAPALVELSGEQARTLTVKAGRRIRVQPTEDPTMWELTAQNHIGTLVCGDRSYLIRPKIPPENVFVLLDVGVPEDGWGSDLFGYDSAGELLPAVLAWFARLVETTLGRGLIRNYHSVEERLISIRGRIDMVASMRQPGLALPVPCRFDEYSADIIENRLLKAVIRLALRVPGVGLVDRRRLRRELTRLEEVADIPATPADFDQIVYNRLNQHYRPALRLARLLLENISLVDRSGDIQAASFLIDMNVVFELFVTNHLRTLLRDRLEVRDQTRVHLDTGRRVLMKPDLELRYKGQALYVADTKYKLTDNAEARTADYYQLLAYTTALDLDEGALIYCRGASGTPQGSVTVRHSGKRLITYALDFNGSPTDIHAEMEELATWLADRCSRRQGTLRVLSA